MPPDLLDHDDGTRLSLLGFPQHYRLVIHSLLSNARPLCSNAISATARLEVTQSTHSSHAIIELKATMQTLICLLRAPGHPETLQDRVVLRPDGVAKHPQLFVSSTATLRFGTRINRDASKHGGQTCKGQVGANRSLLCTCQIGACTCLDASKCGGQCVSLMLDGF